MSDDNTPQEDDDTTVTLEVHDSTIGAASDFWADPELQDDE